MWSRSRSWKPRRGLRFALRRSAALWWTVTLALGLLTTLVVSTSIGRATSAADAWGTERSVWVVRQPLAAGDVIDAAAVRLTRLPRGVVPEGALTSATTPVGEATRVAVQRGEVILTSRLAGRGAHGVAAMVLPGYRAVAVPNDDQTPAVRVGDRVDVLATFEVGDGLEANADSAPAPSFPVASDAEVLAVTPRALTVSVDADDAPRVAFALAKGAVTVALRGGAISAPERSQ
ncbi:MAG: pilus assembly protein CpaB [Actinomycetota bacterium]